MSSGNTASAAPPAAAVDQVKPEGKKQYSWEKKKLDPKDFMFSKLKGQVCIKEPGSINGQQFIIEDCEDCDIYLCDQTATVFWLLRWYIEVIVSWLKNFIARC